MALTYGFYDSDDGDRKYSAAEMNAIFNGLINDGVFATVEGQFSVVPQSPESMKVNVKPGKAWFKNTWTVSDEIIPLTIDAASSTYNRKDSIVLEVDTRDVGRKNSIKVLKGANTTGTPQSINLLTMETANPGIYYRRLANVTVNKGAATITGADIEITVGSSETPFVTGLLEVNDIDDLFQKWQGDFDAWFENVQTQLGDDVAGNLLNLINGKVNTSDRAVASDWSGNVINNTHWMTPKATQNYLLKQGSPVVFDQNFSKVKAKLTLHPKAASLSSKFVMTPPSVNKNSYLGFETNGYFAVYHDATLYVRSIGTNAISIPLTSGISLSDRTDHTDLRGAFTKDNPSILVDTVGGSNYCPFIYLPKKHCLWNVYMTVGSEATEYLTTDNYLVFARSADSANIRANIYYQLLPSGSADNEVSVNTDISKANRVVTGANLNVRPRILAISEDTVYLAYLNNAGFKVTKIDLSASSPNELVVYSDDSIFDPGAAGGEIHPIVIANMPYQNKVIFSIWGKDRTTSVTNRSRVYCLDYQTDTVKPVNMNGIPEILRSNFISGKIRFLGFYDHRSWESLEILGILQENVTSGIVTVSRYTLVIFEWAHQQAGETESINAYISDIVFTDGQYANLTNFLRPGAVLNELWNITSGDEMILCINADCYIDPFAAKYTSVPITEINRHLKYLDVGNGVDYIPGEVQCDGTSYRLYDLNTIIFDIRGEMV